jgi:hypothetical protein
VFTLTVMAAGPARLQISEVEVATAQTLIVVARCLAGSVERGTRFQQVRDVAKPIDLTVTELWRFANRQVTLIDPPHAARVILAGAGGEVVRPGQVIQEISTSAER